MLQSRVRLYRPLNACWANMSTSVTTRRDPTVMIRGADLEPARSHTERSVSEDDGGVREGLEVIEGRVPLDVSVCLDKRKSKTKLNGKINFSFSDW